MSGSGGHDGHRAGLVRTATVGRRSEREAKHGAASGPVLDPDPAAVALDDLAADGEADPGAAVGLAVVQALEHLEHALAVLGLDPDARVLHGELDHSGARRRGG